MMVPHSTLRLGAVACALLLAVIVPAHSQSSQADAQSKGADAWERALEGKELLGGDERMWRLHWGEGELYLELSPGMVERPFLLFSSISRGPGSGFLASGMTLDQEVLAFDVTNRGVVRLVAMNTRFVEVPGPLGRSVEHTFVPSPIMSLRTVAERGSSRLIDLGEIFLDDYTGIGGRLGMVDQRGSSWEEPKVFPRNIELKSNLMLRARGFTPPSVADRRGRGLEIQQYFSIRPLPDRRYQPREADPRVGYFTTTLYDFARSEDRGFIRYINRWRLEKANPQAERSPVKEPVVFWIENTTPYEYRPYVREGIDAWNRAFEEAGLIGAIEVRQMPDDAEWDPEDARYNVVRWSATYNMGFAIGPSRTNPMTGEILDADVIIDANFVRGFERSYRFATEPPGEDERKSFREFWDSMLYQRHPHEDDPFYEWLEERGMLEEVMCRMCQRGGMLEDEAKMLGLQHALLREHLPEGMAGVDTDGLPEEVIGDALRELVMHEVGHTLGLRHNFKAHTLRTLEELQDRDVVREKGFSASVMDYLPMFFSADPEAQGYYSAPDIGPYDLWAIRYGYSSEPLEEILRESTKEEHIYGTDEDARGSFAVDPYCQTWVLGSDPLEYAQNQYELVNRLWEQDWSRVAETSPAGRRANRTAFNVTLRQHFRATVLGLRYIAGIRHWRHEHDDPEARSPIEPVEGDRMRRALQMVVENSLSPDAFDFPREILRELAPNRMGDWGTNRTPTPHFPAAAEIAFERESVLNYLHAGSVVNRLNEIALMDSETLSIGELFETAFESVWAELPHSESIQADRRNLQAAYTQLLARIWTEPPFNYPREGRVLARLMLSRLVERLDASRENVTDVSTLAHVEAMRELAQSALNASVSLDPR